ncbi:MAG: HEAT repeat domain-containing protein [Candidatus Micrarchaeota archaeon]
MGEPARKAMQTFAKQAGETIRRGGTNRISLAAKERIELLGPFAEKTFHELMDILRGPAQAELKAPKGFCPRELRIAERAIKHRKRISELREMYPDLRYEAWHLRHPQGRKAAKELGKRELDDGQLSELIITMKMGERMEVRENAAFALGLVGDGKEVPALCETLLNDPSLVVRRAAATALGEIGDLGAVGALAKSMDRCMPVAGEPEKLAREVREKSRLALDKILGSNHAPAGQAREANGITMLFPDK